MSAVLERQAHNYVPDEYEGLSGTFANACREADRAFRKQQSSQPSQAEPGQIDTRRNRLFAEGEG